MKKSTKKFVSKKLEGVLKKRHERKHVLSKKIPLKQKPLPSSKPGPMPMLETEREYDHEGLDEEEFEGDFEEFIRQEIGSFEEDNESDQEDSDDEMDEEDGSGEENDAVGTHETQRL